MVVVASRMQHLPVHATAHPDRDDRLPSVWRNVRGGPLKLPVDQPIVVSACLAGVECTYKAEAKTRAWALDLVASGNAILVCPEVAGGLSIPRPEAEIQNGEGADVLDGRARVVSSEGEDVTDAYLKGASAAVRAASRSGARLAVLKARSPSCGCGAIYDGTFSNQLQDGDGVCAAALKREGLTVLTDEEVADDV